MPEEESSYQVTLKEVHKELTGKLDKIVDTVQGLNTTVIGELTRLTVRVEHLESDTNRKWTSRGPWIGAGAAIVAAFVSYFVHR